MTEHYYDHTADHTNLTAIDPVCGMSVDPATARHTRTRRTARLIL